RVASFRLKVSRTRIRASAWARRFCYRWKAVAKWRAGFRGTACPDLRATQGPEEEVGSLARPCALFAPNFGPRFFNLGGPLGGISRRPDSSTFPSHLWPSVFLRLASNLAARSSSDAGGAFGAAGSSEAGGDDGGGRPALCCASR